MKRSLGEYNFAAQYQQNPISLGGAMVKTKWIQRYTREQLPERLNTVIQSWDTANKAGELNDWSVCTTWARHKKCFYLLNVFRARLNYPELKRAVHQQYDLYRPSRILIEDKASGTPLIQDLKAGSLYQVTGYLPPTGTDKIMRLHSQTAKFENGLVFLPEEAQWLFEYQRELLSFPGCKYDDQVDSTTQALDYFNTYSSLDAWEGL